MEFQKERVFTALNADELKIGSKVICANTLDSLRRKVNECEQITEVKEILEEDNERRFRTTFSGLWPLVYLVSKPEEKDWIAYLCRRKGVKPYLTCCRSDCWEEVQKDFGAKTKLFEGTEKEANDWYEARKRFADVIAAWEDGKIIQFNLEHSWKDCCNNRPAWDVTSEYRIKPEPLKWTDLKIGDIVHEKNGTQTRMVTVIDTSSEPDAERDVCHICLGGWWVSDEELEDWKKVE